MQATNPNSRGCWVAGFSFGAWISMQLLMRRPEIEGFISIAPPANMYDFGFLAPCPSSGLVVQGAADRIVPEDSVQKLVNKLKAQKGIAIDYEIVPETDHFFTDTLDVMLGHVRNYLDMRMQEAAKAEAS
jgi:hypothetical protein